MADKWEGHGKLTSPDGSEFTGRFMSGAPAKSYAKDEECCYVDVDGSTCTAEGSGFFLKTRLYGQGVAEYSNGDHY